MKICISHTTLSGAFLGEIFIFSFSRCYFLFVVVYKLHLMFHLLSNGPIADMTAASEAKTPTKYQSHGIPFAVGRPEAQSLVSAFLPPCSKGEKAIGVNTFHYAPSRYHFLCKASRQARIDRTTRAAFIRKWTGEVVSNSTKIWRLKPTFLKAMIVETRVFISTDQVFR